MPIILISADGVNENLKDFKIMGIQADIIVSGTDEKCVAILERLKKEIVVCDSMVTNLLDVPRCYEESKLETVLKMIRKMNVHVGIVISREPVLGILDEWDVMAM